VRFVGPSLWEPSTKTEVFPPLTGERPLVLVNASSLPQADALLVSVALNALADEPVQVVATIPHGWERSDLPRNAHLARHVPHGRLLPHAACVVCHGGPGTTQKALAWGVPVVAVPFGRDQFEVARRVEVAGAGVRIHPHQLTPERLLAAVRDAMGRKSGAERVAAAFHRAGGAPAAASAINGLLA
jgi:MGT family glycosyltransferase